MLPRQNKDTFGNIAGFLQTAEIASVTNTNKELSALVETTLPGELMQEARNLNHSLGFRATLAKYTPDINEWYKRKVRECGLSLRSLKEGTYIGAAVGPISGMLCKQLLENNLPKYFFFNSILTIPILSSAGVYALWAAANNYDGSGIATSVPVGATMGFLTGITAYIADSSTAPVTPLVISGLLAVSLFKNKSYVEGVKEKIQAIHHTLKQQYR